MWWFFFIAVACLTSLANGEQPRIVIIGAGPSGVAAASKLFEYGFSNVTILEAEDRIGGRVHTTRFDKYWVDLGAQWVHGQVNNIAFELAEPLGLLEVPNGMGNFTYYTSSGSKLSSDVTENVTALFWIVDGMDEQELTGGVNASLGGYVKPLLNSELRKNSKISEQIRQGIIILFERMLMSLEAADTWDEVLVTVPSEYWTCPGELTVNWKERGYGMILDILMKKYPDPAEELPIVNNTLLGTEVVNVNYDQVDKKVVIQTSNGKSYEADHVIFTPSLGVLKEQHETLFTPALPESKVTAIKGLGFGTVAKVYLAFEEPWWPNDYGFFFIWDEQHRREYENNPDTRWLLDMYSFNTIEHKPNILCGWMSGPGVRYMETLSDEQVFNQSYAILNKFLGSTYNTTRPTGLLRTKWYSNKHFRGTYSHRTLKTAELGASSAELAKPLTVEDKPVVMFAGEATHPHYFSTVHGAIESGMREANRLKDLYDNKLM